MKPPLTPAQLRAAMLTRLAESCLGQSDAKKLRLTRYTASEVKANFPRLPFHRAGFRIPYFDFKGKATKFFRFRYLEYQDSSGFAALTTPPTKPTRYAQEKDSTCRIYLPPYVDWENYLKNKDHDKKFLIITEGELKAACATKKGLPCLGLGGVWNFKSKETPLLNQLEQIVWKDRKVYIAYDSDGRTNPHVMAAENALARELLERGAHVFIARVPDVQLESKTAIDDFIRLKGAEAFKMEVLETAKEWAASRELFRLNEEVVFVEDPILVVKLETFQRISVTDFIKALFAHRRHPAVGANGKTRMVSAPQAWIEWQHRFAV